VLTSNRARSLGLHAAPLVALLALLIVTGLRGIDFGTHWDEAAWQLRPVQEMVSTGLLMPRAAIYPAFSKWLVLMPALGGGLVRGLTVGFEPNVIEAAMLKAVNGPHYLLAVRTLFAVVSSLTLVWVYLSALVLRRGVLEATVAAATLALSWEFAYHARFVATDCIVVQFTALTLLLILAFLRWGRPAFIYGAAVSTGLAIGTKFPAVPLLLPVLIAGAVRLPLHRVRAQLERLVALGATAFGTYLVTTPATVYEPFNFVKLLRYISIRYAHGHYGYSVEPGLPHVSKVLLYFGLSYFSPFRWVSVLLAGLVLVGGYLWARADRKVAGLLVGFPVLFLLFLTTQYSALIVRNYLLLVPFFALLLARTVGEAWARVPRPWARAPLALGLLLLAGSHALFLIRAGESIRHPSLVGDVRQALKYVASEPEMRFRLSPRILSVARSRHLPIPKNARGRDAEHVVFLAQAEGANLWEWPADDPFAIERVFGPREVNLDWYPSWVGADHVIVMTSKKARAIGVRMMSSP
jgi:hypothetical protein